MDVARRGRDDCRENMGLLTMTKTYRDWSAAPDPRLSQHEVLTEAMRIEQRLRRMQGMLHFVRIVPGARAEVMADGNEYLLAMEREARKVLDSIETIRLEMIRDQHAEMQAMTDRLTAEQREKIVKLTVESMGVPQSMLEGEARSLTSAEKDRLMHHQQASMGVTGRNAELQRGAGSLAEQWNRDQGWKP